MARTISRAFRSRNCETEDLIPRQEKPYNAEPRLDVLADAWVTPYSHFYVRNHGTMPTVDGAGYKLTIEGLVDRSVRLSWSGAWPGFIHY